MIPWQMHCIEKYAPSSPHSDYAKAVGKFYDHKSYAHNFNDNDGCRAAILRLLHMLGLVLVYMMNEEKKISQRN